MLLAIEVIAVVILVAALIILVMEERKIRRSKVPVGAIKEYWDGNERRLAFRVNASFVVRYHIERKPSIRLNGYTKDVSSSGMRLVTNEKLSNGTLLLIEFDLPDLKSPISADGKVIWGEGKIDERDKMQRRIFQTGIQFVNMKPEDKNKLVSYIEKNSDDREKTA